jgi:anti-anti-sigma factor
MDAADMTPAPLTLARRTDTSRYVCLDVNGEIDVSNVDSFCRAIREIIEDARTARLDLDVGHLRFIDSTGTGALVEALKLAQDRHIAFAVRNPNGIVLRVLETLGVAKTLTGEAG